MTLTEQVHNAIKKRYEIPPDVDIRIAEELEDEGYGCCGHDSYQRPVVYINYEYVPEGKKRKVKRSHYYSGSVWELIQNIDMS